MNPAVRASKAGGRYPLAGLSEFKGEHSHVFPFFRPLAP